MPTNKHIEIPVYQQIIQSLKSGFDILDAAVQAEIISFLNSQQNKKGAFTDRGRNPDLYYSLFGFWLSLATRNKKVFPKFEDFIHQQNQDQSHGVVEQMALVLIQTELFKQQKKRSFFSILKTVFLNGKQIGLSYQLFLLTLVVDAQNKNKSLYYFFARIVLFFYQPGANLPCSITAALTFAKHKVGLKFEKDQKKIIEFLHSEGGFRAFKTTPNSDTLSTAVALFVLNKTDYDLRLIAPKCLDFVQQNYSSGAFLSGDGDNTKDLEYTFYGLLALGNLVENENKSE